MGNCVGNYVTDIGVVSMWKVGLLHEDFVLRASSIREKRG